MIHVSVHGSFKKTIDALTRMENGDIYKDLDRYGRIGVTALSNATPKDSGDTANSWDYRISHKKGQWNIEWINTNTHNGAQVAILLQYGHGTGTGGYVTGRDYINPAIKPIFDEIANNVWKKVTE